MYSTLTEDVAFICIEYLYTSSLEHEPKITFKGSKPKWKVNVFTVVLSEMSYEKLFL